MIGHGGRRHVKLPGDLARRQTPALQQVQNFESREKNFIYYSLNASVLEEVLLWLQDLKGEGKK